jgi:LysM repeat protein
MPNDEMVAGNGGIKNSSEPIVMEAVKVSESRKEDVYESPKKIYPKGEFVINNTRVIYVGAGTSLLGIAEQYDISLGRLLDFNDIRKKDVLDRGQLLFLQRKRKVSSNEFHIVQKGETLYDIAQEEGIRLESLAHYNNLRTHMNPAPGEKLYLQYKSSSRPVLSDEIIAVNTIEPVFQNITTADVVTKHIVQTKETLYSISKKYGVEVEKILEWNKLQGFDLKIGQELVIHKN